MIERSLAPAMAEALVDTPVVVLVGARQAGKSTLAQSIGPEERRYVTLDDSRSLLAARRDPEGFIAQFETPVTIDEVQLAPELFRAIKAAVDRDRRPGRFLLTGSTDVLFVPSAADALVGRMELLTLWPFSVAELAGRPNVAVVDALFDGRSKIPAAQKTNREELAKITLRGGFPEAVERADFERRNKWFQTYIRTVLDRDVRDLSNVERLEDFPLLLASLAARVRGPMNISAIAQELGIPHTTLNRYLVLLERIYLTKRLSAWHGKVHKRSVKSPKTLISDTGLLCYLLGHDLATLDRDSTAFGVAFENFVGMELVKQAQRSPQAVNVLHYRSSSGDREADFILEAGSKVVAVEVKATETLKDRDFRHLERIRDQMGERFAKGVVLYIGDLIVPLGDRIEAWPVSSLWSTTV